MPPFVFGSNPEDDFLTEGTNDDGGENDESGFDFFAGSVLAAGVLFCGKTVAGLVCFLGAGNRKELAGWGLGFLAGLDSTTGD